MIALTKIPFHRSSPLVVSAIIPSKELAGGIYEWDGTPVPLFPKPNLLENTLYIISSISISVDVSESDWQGAVGVSPILSIHRQGSGLSPVTPLPFPFPAYLRQYSILSSFRIDRGPDSLLCKVRGSVPFVSEFTGKDRLTATLLLTMYEIASDSFVKKYTEEM